MISAMGMGPGLAVGKAVPPARVIVATALLASGCFYTEVINVAPQAAIVQLDPDIPVHIGDTVRLSGSSSRDEDGDDLGYAWQARTCAACAVFRADRAAVFDLVVPPGHAAVHVELRVSDVHGAADTTTHVVSVENRAPGVDIVPSGAENRDGTYVADTPIFFTAAGNDPDGDDLTFSFLVRPPIQSRPGGYEFTRVDAKTYRLLPDAEGAWQVEVTADDGFGGSTTASETVTVAADQPPCIAATTPAWSPDALVIVPRTGGARAFAVESVTDDLDPWPGTEGLRFRWLTALAGAPLVEVAGLDAAALTVDPADFDPGDLLRVRVEIADREARVLPCAADQAACSIGSNACFQRLTWTAEIR
jgi:hypothetical protein